MSAYNALNSIKIDLSKSGICSACGRRFTDPICEHATPKQIEFTRQLDKQADYEQGIKAQKVIRDEMIASVAPMIFTLRSAVAEAFIVDMQTASPVWTHYTPAQCEIARRAIYKGRHIGRDCPKCGMALVVSETRYETTDQDAPHFERRIYCSGRNASGCTHREGFTDEILDFLSKPVTVNEEAEF